MNKVEILAPAGSIESLKAAVNASCDAIYIGGSKFGARAYAQNPDQDHLTKAIEYAHIHDKSIYLTVNTLLKNNELKDELYEYLYKYYNAGLDAVIVQDLGVLNFIHDHFPDLPIHASTQMSLNMAQGANVLKDFGVTRFVPSRELSLSELIDLRKKTDLEIEVFVHGALCYCYSGQCLMSSVLSGRSGNRGRCGQPCRLPYTLVEEIDSNDPSKDIRLSKEEERYLLSPKDISTLDLIPDMIDAGIDSFKIEGRMKRPEYTGLTTYTYKKYVQKYLELGREGYEKYLFDNRKEYEEDKMNLLDIYNRGGFTKGYMQNRNGRSMITLDKPNHSGLEVGYVSKVAKGRLSIKLTKDINKGDVLKVVSGHDDNKTYEYTTGLSQEAGSITETNYDRRVSIERGARVFRVRNNSLIDYLEGEYVLGSKKVAINGFVDVTVGKELELSLDKDGIRVSVSGPVVLEAKNAPMSEEKIIKQVSKINDTNFEFNKLDIKINGSPFIPVSQLNELRRQGIDKLEHALISRFHRDKKEVKDENCLNSYLNREDVRKVDKDKPGLVVTVQSKDQLEEAISRPEITSIYIDSDIEGYNLREIKDLLALVKAANKRTYLYMPHIFRRVTYDYFDAHRQEDNSLFKDKNLDGFVIRNLEEYSFVKDILDKNLDKKDIITDYNLYIMNEEAAKFWSRLGLDKFTVPVELNKHELDKLTGLYHDFIVYGRTPLMVTSQCPMKTVEGGDNNHLNKPRTTYCCGNDKKNLRLVDRLNVRFPVVRNCRHCYNTIYNSLPQSLLTNSRDVLSLNVKNVRLDFTIETRKETSDVLDKFIQVYYYNNLKIEELDSFTRVHFNRGIE